MKQIHIQKDSTEDGKAEVASSNRHALFFQSRSLFWKISATSFVSIRVLNLPLWAFHRSITLLRCPKLYENERHENRVSLKQLVSGKAGQIFQTTDHVQQPRLWKTNTSLSCWACSNILNYVYFPSPFYYFNFHAENYCPICQTQQLHPWYCWYLAGQQQHCSEAVLSETAERSDQSGLCLYWQNARVHTRQYGAYNIRAELLSLFGNNITLVWT